MVWLVRRFSQVPMLRPRQKLLVERAIAALKTHGNTLAVAPTGSGKTFMFSAVIRELAPKKTLVVAHRDELTSQNQRTFEVVNPDVTTSIFNASEKSFDASVVFAMIQSLSRKTHLDSIPKFDLVVFDEAHHVYAPSYQTLVNRIREVNPKVEILGMTATPNRGDNKPIRSVFSNVCDQIQVDEVIASGHLVTPQYYVVDTGFQKQLERAGFFDDEGVGNILNTGPTNAAVIKHWKEKASGRQTVVFCSTHEHSQSVYDAFVKAGVAAGIVHYMMGEKERDKVLENYATGKLQVIVNVAVLAEGWDDPPTSCVVLLRACSSKSVMIQMIGRGLRAPKSPHIVKNDCIVLDFGLSVIKHGSSLSPATHLFPKKTCEKCHGKIDTAVSECPLCGHIPKRSGGSAVRQPIIGEAEDFAMVRLDDSNFQWVEVTPDILVVVCIGTFSCLIRHNDKWIAIGAHGHPRLRLELLAQGTKNLCTAACNDYMNLHETSQTAQVAASWHRKPATDKQLKHLAKNFFGNRYLASALLQLKFNSSTIDSIVFKASGKKYHVKQAASKYFE